MKTCHMTRLYVSIATLLSVSSYAKVLMLDFGSTAPYNPTNSPYHSVSGSFTDTSWNQVAGDVSDGLVWSDGTSAGGIIINAGDSAYLSIAIDLTSAISSSALGSQAYDGIYDGVAKDAIFSNTGTASPSYIGVQISGLTAGTYDIYLCGRNSNTAAGHDQTLLAGASPAGNFDVFGYSGSTLSYPTFTTIGGGIKDWTENETYVKLTVTLDSGDCLNLACIGSAAGAEKRGFLNCIQIVAVQKISARTIRLEFIHSN